MPDTTESRIARIDERTESILHRLDAICERLDTVCEKQTEHGERIAKVETHVNLFAGLNGVAALIAGWLGVRQ